MLSNLLGLKSAEQQMVESKNESKPEPTANPVVQTEVKAAVETKPAAESGGTAAAPKPGNIVKVLSPTEKIRELKSFQFVFFVLYFNISFFHALIGTVCQNPRRMKKWHVKRVVSLPAQSKSCML